MSGIGVITNPRSGHNRRNPRLAGQLAYVLGEKGELVSPNDLNALAAAARRFHDRRIEVLCINGGDGTIHRVLTALVRAYGSTPLPSIALLPGGTMNIVAHSVGQRGRASDVLEALVQAYHEDAPLPSTRRWMLRVGDAFGFLFGNGLIARFLEVYYEQPQPTPARAACLLARGALSALVRGTFARRLTEPFPGEVVVDGVVWPGDAWTAVAVGTVEQMGLGFQPFPDVVRYPRHMQVVGIGSSVVDLAWELPRVWRGQPVVRPGNATSIAREVTLRSDQPISYMIDGDFYRGSEQIRLEMGPAVDFLVPISH